MSIMQNLTPKDYANEWATQSQYFHAQKYYSWMASLLEQNSNIVEIGSGCGLGTLALITAGHKVICVESNIDCVNATIKTLTSNSIKAKLVSSISEAVNSFSNNETPIINIDVLKLKDGEWQILVGQAKLNTIVCWLFGTYPDDWVNHGFDKPSELREIIESTLSNILTRIFPPKSMLNIVNRVGFDENVNVAEKQGEILGGKQFYFLAFTPILEGIAVGTGSKDISKLDKVKPHFASSFIKKDECIDSIDDTLTLSNSRVTIKNLLSRFIRHLKT